jgi:diguanylate cyclase (GGDEF)-like protein
MKILIIDDERTSLLVLKRQLEKWGHEVLAATGGREGLDLLRHDGEISMLVTDWIMPGVDGLEVCREARKMHRKRFLPIMMLTALTDTQDLVQALNAGADAFLSKPVNIAELQAVLRVTERVLDLESRLAAQINALEEARAEIQAMAETDDLTKLPNRRSTLDRLAHEIKRAERYKLPLSIVLMDLDHFKEVNDTHGHPAGDAVLRQTSEVLMEVIRETDFFGRYGGEEFLGIMAQTDLLGAGVIGERLRRAIEAASFDIGEGKTLHRTASLGAACWRHGNDTEERLIARADDALYRAKAGGRNQVRIERG